MREDIRVEYTPAKDAAPATDGWTLLDEGRYEEARVYFAEMTEMNPRLPQPRVGVGVAAALLGDHEAALEAFAAAQQMHPRSFERFGLGEPAQRAVADRLAGDVDALPSTVERGLLRLLGAATDKTDRDSD